MTSQNNISYSSTLLVPPRHVMVSIVDVDDSLPEFQSRDAATSGGCVVPLFSADTSEDYMGELSLSPGTLRAVDGDMTSQNNISYSVMHSEPDDYDVYFHVDEETGRVNKTRKMNSTDPNKYVIFVKAMEDSPQQQSRVAIVSIVVIAPSDPNTDPQSSVNPIVRLVLQIATVFILMAFIVGCVVIFHHRYQVHHSKVHFINTNDNNAKVQFAVYQSSNSSLNTTIPDNPASPSQVTLDNDHLTVPQWNYATGAGFVKSPSSTSLNTINTRRGSVYSNQSQRRKMVVVKKSLDTKQRPGWNAPPTRPKRTSYNPFSSTLLVPPRHVMVSIVDVDDSLPEFQSRDAATSGGCVVPLFSADTSEDYMGELSLSPGTLRAVDGDMTSQNNISYSVMHSEPDDYDVYFHVDEETGRVNKTRKMNSTDPNKYVIFVKAMEDSPQQQSRVAIVSIVVIAPSDPNTDPQSSVNPIVRLVLQIATVFILMAFIVGCVVIFHHRNQVHHSKVKVKDMPSNDNNAKVQFAVYQSSNSSLNTTIPDNPASPSQVTLDNDHLTVPQWNYATGAGFVKSPSKITGIDLGSPYIVTSGGRRYDVTE
ncbi:uncharacterized protein LOC128225381 [Mya arenaria]|uniref:uncharacterized protein LOC128225381 n=1 Tax=Mya arenaria TaxID=6604 RepID=UPI0022E5E5BC|nr:uncharacterized protein LOC128225381 [Mya arenaria]